ncbi:MAG: hypothetical protein K2J07_05900, partial [Muribaculaceae bacterium]|nr:hypothetical protein [Muribaculaceae bacterium]
MKKALLLSLICSIAGSMATEAKVGQAIKWNEGWRFELSDSTAFSSRDFPDSTWRRVTLPHDWSREGIPSPTLAS